MDIDEKAPAHQSQQEVTRMTATETSHDPQIPLAPDDATPVEEELCDVEANNSVSSEHPAPGSSGRVDDPGAASRRNDQEEIAKEPRNMPASDPESGA